MSKTTKLALSLPSLLGSARGSRALGSPVCMNEALLTADSQALAYFLQFFLLHVGTLSCATSLTLGFFVVAMYQNLPIHCCE